MWDILTLSLIESFNDIGQLLGEWIDRHLLNIIVILVGAWLVRHFGARAISSLLRHTIREDLYPTHKDRDKRLRTLNSLVGAAVRIGVYVIAVIMIIGELGVDTGPVLASAGVLGVALGFGAQSLIKDFVSGIFIIVENQYRVGDVVELNNVQGKVEDVTIRTTILRDLNGDVHHIPNGSISVTTNKTIGHSHINEDIIVARDTDLERLEHIINHVGEELTAKAEFKHKIQEPPHFDSLKGFDPSGLIVTIRGKTTAADQWHITSELYKLLNLAFLKNDIQVAASKPATTKSKK